MRVETVVIWQKWGVFMFVVSSGYWYWVLCVCVCVCVCVCWDANARSVPLAE
jgi:hypothetical protein